MKIFIVLLMVLSASICHSQADRMTFSYDTAGNQIIRQICFGCSTSKKIDEKIKDIISLKDEDLQKFSPEDVISFYPNPVREELYLKWDLAQDNALSSISVYGLSGQIIQSYNNLGGLNTKNIPFQRYPSGVYAVILFYSNGEQKSIKIIKK